MAVVSQNNPDQLTETIEFLNSLASSVQEERPHNKARRKHRKRNVPEVSFTEEEISSSEDDFLYCEDCRRKYDRSCPDHGPFFHVMDREVPPGPNPKLAWDTCPDFLSVCNSGIKGAGLGIWTEMDLPKGLLFGPYRGKIVMNRKDAQQSGYSWEIRRRGSPLYYIESTDPSASNWLRFVNCAPTEDRQNLLAFQYGGQIFYKTYKHISAYTELLVWYGDDFGIDLCIGSSEESASEKGGYAYRRNPVKTLSNKRSNIRQISKSCIDDEASVDSGCEPGYLLSREDAAEPDREKSEKAIKDKTGTTGTQSVGFEGSFSNARRLPCEGSGQGESPLNGNPYTDMCVSSAFQTEPECAMMSLIKANNELCSAGKRLLACPDCSYKAEYKCEIRWHVNVVHACKESYQCTHCDHRTTRAALLREHLSTVHAGKKPYKCPQCDHRTTHLSNLKGHIDVVHSGKKPYKCPYCDHRTAKSSDLKRHVDAVHAKVRPHKCPHCTYSAARKGDLKRHLKARHNIS